MQSERILGTLSKLKLSLRLKRIISTEKGIRVKTKLRILSVLVLVSFFFETQLQAAEDSPAFHFVVTGGLMGVSDGSRPFYQSPLFRLNASSNSGDKFVIKNANTKAFRFHNTVFIGKNLKSKNDVVAALPANRFGEVKGFIGAQLFAVGMAGESMLPKDFDSEDLIGELGAIPVNVKWELRIHGGLEILALNSKGENVQWPKASDDVDDVLMVSAGFGEGSATQYRFFPRQVASTDRVFGTVDKLLANDENAQYVDLGDALFGPENEDIEIAKKVQTLILKRKPVALGVGWNDYRAFWREPALMGNGPYVAALSGNASASQLREVKNVRGKSVLFAALPNETLMLNRISPSDSSALLLDEAISSASAASRKSPASLVVGLTQDAQSASRAIESPIFDAVISLVSSKGGALASYDEIDLTQNRKDGLKPVAPLVRVSSVDVTEVFGYTNESGALVRLVIKRHAIVDEGDVAKDAAELLDAYEKEKDVLSLGLPSRSAIPVRGTVYSEDDYNAVLGGLLKEVRPGTELVIIEKLASVTPIEGDIPLKLSESLLNDRGRAVWLSIRGKYLKRILKAAREHQFGVEVSVIGGTLKGPTVAQRDISDSESYAIAVSERVFFAIDRFMARESLFASSNLPSASLQTAMTEGSKETLKILSEIRRKDSRDDTDIGESKSLYASSNPIADLIEPKLSRGLTPDEVTAFLKYSDGKPQRAFVIDISDLDFGLKFNAINDTLSDWQTQGAKDPANNPGFTEPRFWDSAYSQKLIYAKINLKYFGTLVEADLGTNIKFFQPNPEGPGPLGAKDVQKIRPAKDSLKVEWEMRIPFRRVFNEPPLGFWDLGAVTKLTYETQIWPNTWLTNLPEKDWPFRTNDIRLLMGLSLKPLASVETLRFGGVLDYDISRGSFLQSFSYGLELGGQGKWNVGFIGIKVDSTIRQLFSIANPDITRMGLVWTVDGKVEVPIYGGFSMSLLANTALGTRMQDPGTPGYTVLFGFALSYSERLKWLF